MPPRARVGSGKFELTGARGMESPRRGRGVRVGARAEAQRLPHRAPRHQQTHQINCTTCTKHQKQSRKDLKRQPKGSHDVSTRALAVDRSSLDSKSSRGYPLNQNGDQSAR